MCLQLAEVLEINNNVRSRLLHVSMASLCSGSTEVENVTYNSKIEGLSDICSKQHLGK
jgi:hypothetical protein